MTTADQLVAILATGGVKPINGIVGDSLNGITASIRRHGKIGWLRGRHEDVAAFAAGAEAQLTGRSRSVPPAAAAGDLRLINGLFDCSSPAGSRA